MSAVPILKGGADGDLRTASHESNAFPVYFLKLLSRYVDEVLAVPEARKISGPTTARSWWSAIQFERVDCALSMPTASRQEKRWELGIKCASFPSARQPGCTPAQSGDGGLDCMSTKESGPCTGKIHHIHATGKYGVEDLPADACRARRYLQENPNVNIREYINDMDDCLAAADLVICRAEPPPSEAGGCGRHLQFHRRTWQKTTSTTTGWCWSKTRLRSSSRRRI